MMMKRFYPTVLLTALLMIGGSCTEKEPLPGERGEIAVTFTTGELQTRAVSGDPTDGGGIHVDASGAPDLAIAIANSDGDFVAWYPATGFWTAAGDMATGYVSRCETEHAASTPASAATIFFTGLQRGSYTVYSVANTTGLSDDLLSGVKGCSTVSELEALQLPAPSFSASMPLTARGTLNVNANGNGLINLQLLRPVARVRYSFKNMTEDNDLEIHDCKVTIGAMDPAAGYLMPRETDYVAGGDGDLVIESADPLVFGADPDDSDTYRKASLPVAQVFPSIAPARTVGNRYLCTVTFQVTKQGETNTYTFTDLPVHDARSADILCLKRNQLLQIETRITKTEEEHDYSFNFEVQSWEEKENYLTFD